MVGVGWGGGVNPSTPLTLYTYPDQLKLCRTEQLGS